MQHKIIFVFNYKTSSLCALKCIFYFSQACIKLTHWKNVPEVLHSSNRAAFVTASLWHRLEARWRLTVFTGTVI